MGLLSGGSCMILTSTVFDWSTRVTDRWMGDSIYHAIAIFSTGQHIAYAAQAICCCALKSKLQRFRCNFSIECFLNFTVILCSQSAVSEVNLCSIWSYQKLLWLTKCTETAQFISVLVIYKICVFWNRNNHPQACIYIITQGTQMKT